MDSIYLVRRAADPERKASGSCTTQQHIFSIGIYVFLMVGVGIFSARLHAHRQFAPRYWNSERKSVINKFNNRLARCLLRSGEPCTKTNIVRPINWEFANGTIKFSLSTINHFYRNVAERNLQTSNKPFDRNDQSIRAFLRPDCILFSHYWPARPLFPSCMSRQLLLIFFIRHCTSECFYGGHKASCVNVITFEWIVWFHSV